MSRQTIEESHIIGVTERRLEVQRSLNYALNDESLSTVLGAGTRGGVVSISIESTDANQVTEEFRTKLSEATQTRFNDKQFLLDVFKRLIRHCPVVLISMDSKDSGKDFTPSPCIVQGIWTRTTVREDFVVYFSVASAALESKMCGYKPFPRLMFFVAKLSGKKADHYLGTRLATNQSDSNPARFSLQIDSVDGCRLLDLSHLCH